MESHRKFVRPGPSRICPLLVAAAAAGSLLCDRPAAAVDVSVTGNWSVAVGSGDLTNGPGSDLEAIKESSAGQATIDVSAAASSDDQWRIDVSRLDSVWPSSVALQVRRNSDGSGSGSISGGTSYVATGASATTFFSGSGNRSSIGLQLEITGLSTAVTPDAYSTTLIYTVVDL